MMRRRYKPDVVLADIPRANDPVEFKLADVPAAEKLEKFLEDVKWVRLFNMSTKRKSDVNVFAFPLDMAFTHWQHFQPDNLPHQDLAQFHPKQQNL